MDRQLQGLWQKHIEIHVICEVSPGMPMNVVYCQNIDYHSVVTVSAPTKGHLLFDQLPLILNLQME